ncbi:MAG: hypothetical protein V7647_1344 [Acidobacteriota bacterium]|jgi:hypothetical protein
MDLNPSGIINAIHVFSQTQVVHQISSSQVFLIGRQIHTDTRGANERKLLQDRSDNTRIPLVVPMSHLIDRCALGFALLSLVCWLLLFAAGHDVWHDMGRPDVLARLSELGATLFDIRAAAYAFYGLFVLLSAQVIVTGLTVFRRR